MRLQTLALTGVVALLWVLLYSLNHIIFIPSGYKIAVVSLFRMRVWLGLFLGAIITGYLFLNGFPWIDIVFFSFLSATLPYIAFELGRYCVPLNRDLSNLGLRHITLIGLIYATLNGCFHLTYRYHGLFLRNGTEVHEILSMMVGDIAGILITMLLLSRLSKSRLFKSLPNK